MTTPNVTENSNSDFEEITDLLNRQLENQGIKVEADQKDNCIYILLESKQIQDRKHLLDWIGKSIMDLGDDSIEIVKVYGYKLGDPFPSWVQQIELTRDYDLWKLPTKVNKSSVTSIDIAKIPKVNENNKVSLITQSSLEHNDRENALTDRFLVCGLGSLGQYCVVNLKKFASQEADVCITAIDKVNPDSWEIDDMQKQIIEKLIIGDCCKEDILIKAGVMDCRAILLVTNNEGVNIEAAIAARRLNPKIRLVVRSSRQNLNKLLKNRLGNFIALEPTELPATAFALAGLGGKTLSFFNIGNTRLRVVEQQVLTKDIRFDNLPVSLLHKKNLRLLRVPNADSEKLFFQWQPDMRVQASDRIAYIEEVEFHANTFNKTLNNTQARSKQVLQFVRDLVRGDFRQKVDRFQHWLEEQRSRQIIFDGLVTGVALWSLSAVILKFNVPSMTWEKAIANGVILLLAGFGDVFGGLDAEAVPFWVQSICFLVTVASLLFLSNVLGQIADNFLSSRFDFLKPRLPIPEKDHIVLVGLGRVGRRVASILEELGQPIVAITDQIDIAQLLPEIPVLTGNIVGELEKSNLSAAKSLVVMTDDQMLNLEVALMAREAALAMHREIGLVVRTYDSRFSESLSDLLPHAKALCVYELSSEAFAGAAFGENMLQLFRLNNRTILVAEYQIEEADTLNGKILAQIAYGFDVVPIFYQKFSSSKSTEHTDYLMPSDDIRLGIGDRLIVLASISGLRLIERGEASPPRLWRLHAKKPLSPNVILDAGNTLRNISGCSLNQARDFINSLPGFVELPLYDIQAYRLGHELNKQLPVKLFLA
ncbi:TrkA family potassium uptake protein [Pseudanabaena sp. 'Roaring Creek']|uniref:potassium channel family protein n=1 Tax=Pseudanabaena sp. 'Roaring Creek' TaxID=1681830 RepID=UPI0006D795B7|nr:NAD-binding protein [Pseudanabaena sp. 'Roaring Creek']